MSSTGGALAGTFVEVVHAQRAAVTVVDVDVVRLEREIGKIGEALVGGAQALHAGQSARQSTVPAGAGGSRCGPPDLLREASRRAKLASPTRNHSSGVGIVKAGCSTPPSISKILPVTHDAAGEARYTTAAAMSST